MLWAVSWLFNLFTSAITSSDHKGMTLIAFFLSDSWTSSKSAADVDGVSRELVTTSVKGQSGCAMSSSSFLGRVRW